MGSSPSKPINNFPSGCPKVFLTHNSMTFSLPEYAKSTEFEIVVDNQPFYLDEKKPKHRLQGSHYRRYEFTYRTRRRGEQEYSSSFKSEKFGLPAESDLLRVTGMDKTLLYYSLSALAEIHINKTHVHTDLYDYLQKTYKDTGTKILKDAETETVWGLLKHTEFCEFLETAPLYNRVDEQILNDHPLPSLLSSQTLASLAIGKTGAGHQLALPSPLSSQPLAFLAIGKTGAGKSTFLNAFIESNNDNKIEKAFQTGSAEMAAGVTHCISSKQGVYNQSPFEVFDTPGVDDLRVTPVDWCLDFFTKIIKRKISKLFIVLRADQYRIDHFHVLMIRFFAEFISTESQNPSQNIALVFTHVDKLEKTELTYVQNRCEKFRDKLNEQTNKFQIEQIYLHTKGDPDFVAKIFEDSKHLTDENKLIFRIPDLLKLRNIVKDVMKNSDTQY